jgi:[glutamine synthetase] adenylyltransferase / [glutamine synthetase]-adenylyl-L-tyrosine phosphorylase
MVRGLSAFKTRDFMPLTSQEPPSSATGARALQHRLVRELSPCDGSARELEMRAARQRHAEHVQRIRNGLVRGELHPETAGRMIADAAAYDVRVMADLARTDVARRRGPVRGAMAILALGKLGGSELTLGADLDLMFVFAADDSRTEIFAEIAALTLDGLTRFTEDGGLYDVDMRLRPYGDKGPVAVQASSFKRYFAEEAWTFEAQSLTRARVIAGDSDFGIDLIDAAAAAIAARAQCLDVRADIAAMRTRVAAHKPAANAWDVKLARGGLIDVEFITQAHLLEHARDGGDPMRANSGQALAALSGAGVIEVHLARELRSAWRLYSNVRHLKKALCLKPREMAEASDPALGPMLTLCGEASVGALTETLLETQARVRALFSDLFGARSAEMAAA